MTRQGKAHLRADEGIGPYDEEQIVFRRRGRLPGARCFSPVSGGRLTAPRSGRLRGNLYQMRRKGAALCPGVSSIASIDTARAL